MKSQLEEIARAIQEASAWCEFRLDQKRSLRSSELNPGQSLTFSDEPCQLVDHVCATRSALLDEHKDGLARASQKGKLLLYYPHLSLSDGAAELVSDGFFDANNEPAWDVWVFCDRHEGVSNPQDYGISLLSWIPNRLVYLVEEGIHINPEGCLEWVDESKHPFATKLRGSISVI